MTWLPYLGLAGLAGLVNLANAAKQLADDARYYVFFRPLRVPAVYLWALVQLAFPASIVWVVLKFGDRPVIGGALLTETIGFGLGFVVVMNGTTQVAGFNIDLPRRIYQSVVSVAISWIASGETGRTTTIWTAFQNEIAAAAVNLAPGFQYLRTYLGLDISLSGEKRAANLDAINTVAAIANRAEQVPQVRAVMFVRRRDLPDALRAFGCSQGLIDSLKK
jgi:hypothetical protein